MRGKRFQVSNSHHDLNVARICKDHKKQSQQAYSLESKNHLDRIFLAISSLGIDLSGSDIHPSQSPLFPRI